MKDKILALTWCGVLLTIVYLSLSELKQPEKEKNYKTDKSEIYYR